MRSSGEMLGPLPAYTAVPHSEVAKQIVRDFTSDKAVVGALGRQYGFRTLFVWQLTVADKPVLSEQERGYAGWLPASTRSKPALAWWEMAEELRDVYQTIGATLKSDIGVVDISNAFDGVSANAFIDWMHPSEEGNEPSPGRCTKRSRSRFAGT